MSFQQVEMWPENENERKQIVYFKLRHGESCCFCFRPTAEAKGSDFFGPCVQSDAGLWTLQLSEKSPIDQLFPTCVWDLIVLSLTWLAHWALLLCVRQLVELQIQPEYQFSHSLVWKTLNRERFKNNLEIFRSPNPHDDDVNPPWRHSLVRGDCFEALSLFFGSRGDHV